MKCLESPVPRVRERSKWPIPSLWTITVALFLRKSRMFLMEAIALRNFPVIGRPLSAVKQNGKPSEMGKLQRTSETQTCETRRVSSLAIFSSSVGNLPPCVSHTHTHTSFSGVVHAFCLEGRPFPYKSSALLATLPLPILISASKKIKNGHLLQPSHASLCQPALDRYPPSSDPHSCHRLRRRPSRMIRATTA